MRVVHPGNPQRQVAACLLAALLAACGPEGPPPAAFERPAVWSDGTREVTFNGPTSDLVAALTDVGCILERVQPTIRECTPEPWFDGDITCEPRVTLSAWEQRQARDGRDITALDLVDMIEVGWYQVRPGPVPGDASPVCLEAVRHWLQIALEGAGLGLPEQTWRQLRDELVATWAPADPGDGPAFVIRLALDGRPPVELHGISYLWHDGVVVGGVTVRSTVELQAEFGTWRPAADG